ncbi:MAG: molybdopterin-guanine dinucleotide biosynthesis protein B [Candidatus Latescibacterota bacterium]|nr:MAG: molybdopterin-guanine dinucleotide biosynthesis protein B [Candidatus Latescibacterota bacterium]
MTTHFFRITGAKNSGKTTLIVKLTEELIGRGYRVGTMKHSSHDHEFDRSGSDSHHHSVAGSSATIILSPNKLVCHTKRPPSEELFAIIRQAYHDIDIVLCEGFARFPVAPQPTPMIECVAAGEDPLFTGDPDLVAVVADKTLPVDVPLFPHSATTELATWLEKTFHLAPDTNTGSP